MRPIGAHQEVPVDARILSATHKDLAALATDGRFRRTCTTASTSSSCTSPRSGRREDIPDLVGVVRQRLTQHGKTAVL